MLDVAPFETEFAHSVMNAKYMRPHGETHWYQTADRVVFHPMEALDKHTGSGLLFMNEYEDLRHLVRERRFMPGGRYLYAAGNPYHQVQNCLLLSCEDTREGWADLGWKAEMALLTGAGIGVYWGKVRPNGTPVGRTGGTASGPVPKMIATNEQGRAAVQGGDRRSAIWAGHPWQHADVFWFMRVKNWPEYLKEAKRVDPSIPAPMDMTNISVCLDDEFFTAFNDPNFAGAVQQYDGTWASTAPDGGRWHDWAQRVYWTAIDGMTQTGEPGFSVDIGTKREEKLRNAPVTASTRVLTREGYKEVGEIVDTPICIWTGKQWANDVVFKHTSDAHSTLTVHMTGGRSITCDPSHPFMINGDRVPAEKLDVSLPEVETTGCVDAEAYTLGWIYGDGSVFEDRADLTLCSAGSMQCRLWMIDPDSENPCDGRGFHRMYFRSGFHGLTKEAVSADIFGYTPDQIASFVAGLMDADGNYEPVQQRIRLASKHESFLKDVARLLEQLGIIAHVSLAGTSTYGKSQGHQLVIAADYHDLFVELIPCRRVPLEQRRKPPYRVSKIKVLVIEEAPGEPVYCANVGVPEHTFVAEGVVISNCCEIVSADDSDICNLGGLSLSRFESVADFEHAVRLGTLFLIAGTIYSDVPYPKVAEVREKNRRLGLDLIGVHEFLLKRGLRYGTDDAFAALEPYMQVYDRALEFAADYADKAGVSRPIAVTSGAPTGTRAIGCETTTGHQVVTAAAYKRDVITSKAHEPDQRTMHYVIDPTVARLISQGYIHPSDPVEDSYTLAADYERVFRHQAYAQSHTDQAISMTVNLEHVMTDAAERKAFGDTLYKYLPKLRGITVYPNGAIAGQPITPCLLEEALNGGAPILIEETEDKCASGVCGI